MIKLIEKSSNKECQVLWIHVQELYRIWELIGMYDTIISFIPSSYHCFHYSDHYPFIAVGTMIEDGGVVLSQGFD